MAGKEKVLGVLLGNIGKQAEKGLLAPKEMASRSAFRYNPFIKPLRNFELDYPHGAATDEAGRLLKTIDGADFTGRFVVGRTMAGRADQALSPTEFDTIGKAITGQDVAYAALPGSDMGRVAVNR